MYIYFFEFFRLYKINFQKPWMIAFDYNK